MKHTPSQRLMAAMKRLITYPKGNISHDYCNAVHDAIVVVEKYLPAIEQDGYDRGHEDGFRSARNYYEEGKP